MTVEHPNSYLSHEAKEPYPKVFPIILSLLLIYLVTIFVSVGTHYMAGSHG